MKNKKRKKEDTVYDYEALFLTAGQHAEELEKKLTATEAKLTEAGKALKKHGQHLTRPMCKKGGPIRCSCGFDEALSKIQSNIESP